MRKLLNTKECPLKGYFTGKFAGESTKDLEIAIKISDAINDLSLSELQSFTYLSNYLTENISASYFKLSYERTGNINLIASALPLAVQYVLDGRNFLKKGLFEYLKLPNTNREIRISFSFLTESNGDYYFTCIRKGKQKYAVKPKSNGSMACLETYVKYLAAKKYLDSNGLTGNIYIEDIALTPSKQEIWSVKNEVRKICLTSDLPSDYMETLHDELLNSDVDIKNKQAVICENNNCSICTYSVLCKYLQNTDFNHNKLVPVKKKVDMSKAIQLTENQRKLVDSKSGIIRVLASAGSGKTTVLAGLRTCNLISYYGYDADDFLFLTFSERGVKEIKEKINYWAEYTNIDERAKDFKIFTFNGFGQKIIDDHYKALGYTTKPTLILRSEKLDLIANALEKVPQIPKFNYLKPDMEMFRAKGVIPSMEEYFSWLNKHPNQDPLEALNDYRQMQKYRFMLTKEEAGDNPQIFIDNIHSQIYEVYKIYNELKREKNYIEYDDQIKCCLEILSVSKWAKDYGAPHLIVDEFQDSDVQQLEIIKKLISVPQFESFVACGDDSQSIFSWRGATTDNIINFKEHFEYYGKVKDIELVDNFRCNNDITEFANKINDFNNLKVNKKVKAYKAGNGKAVKLSFYEKDLFAGVDNTLKRFKAEGFKYRDIAIIARTNDELTKISKHLAEKKVPYNLVVAQKLTEIPEVRGLMSFGKWYYYPDNYLYFTEFYQIISPESILENDFDSFIKIEDETKERIQNMSDEELLVYFKDVVKDMKDINNGTKTFAKLLEQQEFENINDLCAWLCSFIDYNENIPVEKDLNQYEAVTLMTAHSCKGAEFKAVGVSLDRFDGTKVGENLDEERRGLFVACTRAKDALQIFATAPSPTRRVIPSKHFQEECDIALEELYR